MYERDQRAIAAYARQSPENFARVVKFVYLTVQQPLHSLGGLEARRDQMD
jgi:hypothetical protein